jgi:hypothetical protein
VIGLGAILTIVTLPSLVVFVLVFRRVRDSLDEGAGMSHDVPSAMVVAGAPRFTAGRTAQRIARRIPTIQAGLVSFAIASITFMIMSVIAMAAIAITA